jgi:hypothetical protein
MDCIWLTEPSKIRALFNAELMLKKRSSARESFYIKSSRSINRQEI